MKLQRLVEDLAKDHGWYVNQDDDGWIVGIATEGERTQSVHVQVISDTESGDIALVWSEVAEAARFGDPWQLMDFNWKHVHAGSLALRGKSVVLTQRQLLKTVDPEELEASILGVGKTADAIEREIYGDLDLN